MPEKERSKHKRELMHSFQNLIRLLSDHAQTNILLLLNDSSLYRLLTSHVLTDKKLHKENLLVAILF